MMAVPLIPEDGKKTICQTTGDRYTYGAEHASKIMKELYCRGASKETLKEVKRDLMGLGQACIDGG